MCFAIPMRVVSGEGLVAWCEGRGERRRLDLALVGAQLTSLTISREWERGTMEQLISTPVTALAS